MTTDNEDTIAQTDELPDDTASLKALLEEERQKSQSFMASWQRAAADYQNNKRRVEEERSETARFAGAALIINLLPMIDDLERALMNVDTSAGIL